MEDIDLEQYCLEGMTQTYASPDRIDGTLTMGGYSDKMVVSEISACLNQRQGGMLRYRTRTIHDATEVRHTPLIEPLADARRAGN